MNKTSRSVVTDYRLELRFEQLRTRLGESSQADGLERPLAFFAASNDRHLPLALIDRKVRELIGASLSDLRSVPGIGPKKLNSLMDLLERALPQPAAELVPPEPEPELSLVDAAPVDGEQPGRVSEADWEQWCAAIRRHLLGRETLGRFAPTLRRLPRSLWTAPLDGYLDSTLGELRRRKNHGEKRVSAILEIFGGLHKVLLRLDEQSHLSVHLRPRFATSIERWLAFRLRHEELPTLDEVNQAFVEPLIEQLDVDGGDTHAKLARDRLNPKSSGMGNAARRMGLAAAALTKCLATPRRSWRSAGPRAVWSSPRCSLECGSTRKPAMRRCGSRLQPVCFSENSLIPACPPHPGARAPTPAKYSSPRPFA